MGKRVLVWGGAVVAVLALAALAVYLAEVGLDKADKLASVIGVFVAVAGLAMSGYGLARERSSASSPSAPVRPEARQAPVKRQVNVARDGATLYAVMDGTMDIGEGGFRAPRRAEGDTASSEDGADPGGA